jgi:hypothetical protein
VALLVATSVARTAGAQDRRVLEAHVASLGQRFLLADSVERAYSDSVAKANATLDTAVVGVFHIAASPRLAAVAREAATVADRDVRRVFGAAAERFSNHRLVLRESSSNGRGTNQVIIAEFEPGTQESNVSMAPQNAMQIAAALRNRALGQLTRDLGPAFNAWLRAGLWTDPVSAADWSSARLMVVSSHASVARGCYRGATADCVALLGLAPAKDTTPLPINPMRTTFVQEAARLGGAGAYERLVTAPGGVRERIAAAARVPFDSVVRSWQYNIRNTRVASDAMSPTIAAASLGWIVLCVGLSLRSSRWR